MKEIELNSIESRKFDLNDMKTNIGDMNVSLSIDSMKDSSNDFNCVEDSVILCTSPHEGRKIVETILPINIDVLFNLLFSKSTFYTEFHRKRKSNGFDCGEWVSNDDGIKTRSLSYNVAFVKFVKSTTVSLFKIL